MMIPDKPNSVIWTDAQWQAIHLKDTNILVSAGAGSGKTAVLTERVFQRVKNGSDINRLLIVTFTKAAALEMKERIRKRLIDAVSEGDESLYPQLSLLEIAPISTFDSFSYGLVQKYGYLVGLPPDITIGDKVLIDQLKNDVLDRVIAEKHREKDPDFLALVRRYTIKDGRKIRSMVLELTESLMKRPDFFAILKHPQTTLTEASKAQLIQDLERELHAIIEQIRVYLKTLKDYLGDKDNEHYITDLISQLDPLFSLNRYDEIRHFMAGLRLKNQPRHYLAEESDTVFNTYKDLQEKLKKKIKHLQEFTEEPLAHHFHVLAENAPYLKTLNDLTHTYITRLIQRQFDDKIFDFQSMAYLSIDLLRNFPDALKEVKASYHEILVDEYQDTSPLQDALMTMISDQNLYTVGDIKQSIYRFRDADPKLFQKKYHAYVENNTGKVIHLNENFRSRKPVIKHINQLFEKIMDATVGGVDYQKDHALKFGFQPYQTVKTSQDYGMTFMTYDKKDFDDHYDTRQEDYSKKQSSARAEAQMIVKDIIDKVNQGYQVYDKKTGQLRPALYHDFVILIDRKNHFNRFLEVFQSFHVPLHIHQQDTFISNTDVLVIVNLFKLLLSLSDPVWTPKYFKHAFLSVAYSYITEATHDQIIDFMVDIRLEPTAIFEAAEGTPFQTLMDVMKALIEEKDYLKLSDILERFHQDLDLLKKGLSLWDIGAIEERLIYLLDQVKNFEHQAMTLKDLVTYYQYAVTHHNPLNFFSSVDIDYVRGTAVVEDKVNLMTIHKSKGLEFPVVYYPQLTLPWKPHASTTRYSSRYGLLMPAEDNGLTRPLTMVLDDILEQKEVLSERIRLLYVALTRTQEAMLVIYQKNPDDLPSSMYLDENQKVYPLYKEQFKDYQSIFHAVFETYLKTAHILSLEESDYTEPVAQRFSSALAFEDTNDLYTYQEIPPVEASITQEMDDQEALIHPSYFARLELGTLIHNVLKYLDFKAPIKPQLKAYQLASNIESMILDFFAEPRIKNYIKGDIIKEYPYLVKTGETIERGIIDCIFITDETITVLDYKTRDIDDDEYLSQVMQYVTYLHDRFQKPVSGLLYSIVEQRFKVVVENYQGKSL